MENYHKKDQWTKIRDLNNDKRRVDCAYERTTLLAEKTSACYNQIENFVKKEMKKGKTLEEAIKIVSESEVLEKIYPQFKEEAVKKKIFNLIRYAEYSKGKKIKNKEKEDGEIEL